MIQWHSPRHDVDLQVEDPAGEVYSFQRRKVPGRPGELSVDTTHGPGVELWESAPAMPGTYKLYYRFYASNGNPAPVSVSGMLYSRQGRLPLPILTLNHAGERRLAATLVVIPDGSVHIH